jgi:hypothetical protein
MTLLQTLFDKIPRSYKGPKGRSEPSFDYLSRSARSEVDRVRHVLEEWFSRFPVAAQPDLRSRFRSKDDPQHLGAFFELYLHELVYRLGMNVEVHPASPGTKKTRPDFKASRGGKPVFYLEATLAASSDADISVENIKNRVYDALNRMNSPNFFIDIEEVKGAPTTDPPARKIRQFLEQQLKDLDPDAIARQFKQGGLRALPCWTWQHGEWKVTFRPIPKSPKARGKPGVRPIGAHMKAGWVAPQEGIRDAVRKKATKYGNLDLPYIIAVNALDIFVDQDAVIEALFGDECIVATLYKDESTKHHLSRKPTGAFCGPQGPQNTRVSGVLMLGGFGGLRPWNVATEEPVLWHNPWASYPLLPEMWPLPKMICDPSSSRMVKCGGLEVAGVLGLPPEWPRSLSD